MSARENAMNASKEKTKPLLILPIFSIVKQNIYKPLRKECIMDKKETSAEEKRGANKKEVDLSQVIPIPNDYLKSTSAKRTTLSK